VNTVMNFRVPCEQFLDLLYDYLLLKDFVFYRSSCGVKVYISFAVLIIR
jgi:hypothetical protein